MTFSGNSKSKAVSIGMIMGVDVGNVNAGWTEGIVTVIKKVERPDGFFHPYISGQALRRYMRDTMKDILTERKDSNNLALSPEEKGIDKKAPVVTEGDPRKYIDDDLFGFMKAIKKERGKKKGKEKSNVNENEEISENVGSEEIQAVVVPEEAVGTRKRTSPLRISPAFGMFKLNSDRDLGTRSAIELTKSADAGGSIFETEITHNLFRSVLLLELDRVGIWKGYETVNPQDKDGGQLDENARKERIAILLESLKYLWGGGRQSRFLVNLTPNFIIYARMQRKVPLFLNSLDVEYTAADAGNSTNLNYRIKTENLEETIKDYSSDIQSLIIGARSGQFSNTKSDYEKLHDNVQILTVGSAIDSMISDIQSSRLY